MKQSINSISQLKQAQSKIITNIEYLQKLNINYMAKQEKSFMSTFLFIMDKMSNQLYDAHEHYRNIDKQISADKKCVKLANQLRFFQNQCIQLAKQLEQTKLKITQQKIKQQKLNQQTYGIKKSLTSKIKAIQKYRSISTSATRGSRYQHNKRNLFRSIDLGKRQELNGSDIIQPSINDQSLIKQGTQMRGEQTLTSSIKNIPFRKSKQKQSKKIVDQLNLSEENKQKYQNASQFRQLRKYNRIFD